MNAIATVDEAGVLAERKTNRILELNRAFENKNSELVAYLKRGGSEDTLHPYAKKRLEDHRRNVRRLMNEADGLHTFAEQQETLF